MAASNSQRNWNRFFDKSNGKSAETVDKRAGPKRIRRAKTTCEHYEKSMETCRLSGEMCMSPGSCPDYARRPEVDAAAAPRPKADTRKKPQTDAIDRPDHPEVSAHATPRVMANGHAMAASGDWDPSVPGGKRFRTGQVVVHKYFGKGAVSDVSNDRITVQFDAAGTRVLHAPFFLKNPIMYIQH